MSAFGVGKPLLLTLLLLLLLLFFINLSIQLHISNSDFFYCTDTSYVLANYKTEQCKRPPRLCRQGYACPQYHNSRDRRRPPKRFKYRLEFELHNCINKINR